MNLVVMLRQGISASGGGAFLQKPFTAQQLSKKVRDVLDGRLPGHALDAAGGTATGKVA